MLSQAEEKASGTKQRKLVGTGAKLNWREAAKKNVGDDIVFDTRARGQTSAFGG